MTDSIEGLARDFSHAHPKLGDLLVCDITVWRRVIARAIAGNAAYRALLLNECALTPIRDDLSRRARAMIFGTDSAEAKRADSAAVASSTTVTGLADGAQDAAPSRLGSEVWPDEEFTDRDAVSHASTITPPATGSECPR